MLATLEDRPKAPSLLRHCRGAFYVRLPDGGSKWFGSDPEAAMTAWNKWAAALPITERKDGRAISVAPRAERGRMETIAPTIKIFCRMREAECAPDARRNWAVRMAAFSAKFGDRGCSAIKPLELAEFRLTLAKKSPSYGNAIIFGVRAYLDWLYEMGFVDAPYRLGVLKPFSPKPPASKAQTAETVRALIAGVYALKPNYGRLMALQFYAALRPSEACRLLREWDGKSNCPEIYSKTTNKVGQLRTVPLSEPALTVLRSFQRPLEIAATPQSYRLAVKRAGRHLDLKPFGLKTLAPHFLRHSSAQSLVNLGSSDDVVRTALGRVRAKVDRCYVRSDNYDNARKAMGGLADLVPLKTVGLK